MTSKQSDDNLGEIMPKPTKSELDDFIFLKPHRKKKRVKGSVSDSLYGSDEAKDDTPFVKSDRSNKEISHKRKKQAKHRKHRKMKRWKKVLLSIACVFLSLIIIMAGCFAFLLYRGSKELLDTNYKITAPQGVDVQNDGEYIVYNGNTYQLNKNITSILFMGIDKRELEQSEVKGTGGQADVLVLMAVDTQSGKISMMNISRDTMTDVTVYSANGGYVGSEQQQICLSYAYGDGKVSSCENTVNSVKRLFYNIPIKSYLALDLDGIAAVNDSIGGVDVTSPETVGEFVKGQQYHLEGTLSESFIRARGHDSADANTLRMMRQQLYATEFMNKVISATKQKITTPVDLFNASSPYTCTNLNPSKISYLAQSVVLSNGLSVEMSTVPGKAQMGDKYAEYYINEKEFYELFLSVYYNKI